MSVRVSRFSKSVALWALPECALAEPSSGEAACGAGGCVSSRTTDAGTASAAASVSEAERDEASDSMLELRVLASGGTLSPDGARTVMATTEAGGASLVLMMLSLEDARARLSMEAARRGAAGGSGGARGGAARDTVGVSSREGEASGAATDGAGAGAGTGAGAGGSGSEEREIR